MTAGKIKGQDITAKEKKPRHQKDKDGSEEQADSVVNASAKATKKKKNKKGETKDGSLNRETKTMKKKKLPEGFGSVGVSELHSTLEEPSGKKRKKHKKNDNASVQSKAAGGVEEDEDKALLAVKKKKSKKVKVNPIEVITLDEEEDDVDIVHVTTSTKKKKKKKKKNKTVTNTVAAVEEPEGVHHKAKKRKAPLEIVDDQIVKKKDKTKQPKAEKAPSIVVVVVDEESPKPKKKKKQTKQAEEVALKVEVAQERKAVGDKEPKRKRTKNGLGQTFRDTAQNTETFVFEALDSKGKGKRDVNGAPEEIKIKAQQEEVEVSVKKKKKKCKKIKLEKDAPGTELSPEVVPHNDVVFLSEKTGNRDEVTINQERRMALQMEVDKESCPRTPVKPLAAQGFGQWSTAQFDSTDKQQKFLRLMGGFKAAKTSGPGDSSGASRPNMALAQDKQKDLQQALLGEFERAQSRRVDFSVRGAGLGFSAPPNKKFAIDANASRSVRFDD